MAKRLLNAKTEDLHSKYTFFCNGMPITCAPARAQTPKALKLFPFLIWVSPISLPIVFGLVFALGRASISSAIRVFCMNRNASHLLF